MRTIIAGSRGITDAGALTRALENCGWEPSAILTGGARGADELGMAWARGKGLLLELYQPDWRKGRSAGLQRNTDMAERAEALIALWDGQSKGTKHMIAEAQKRGLRVHVERC
jgi:hypothetical protein